MPRKKNDENAGQSLDLPCKAKERSRYLDESGDDHRDDAKNAKTETFIAAIAYDCTRKLTELFVEIQQVTLSCRGQASRAGD